MNKKSIRKEISLDDICMLVKNEISFDDIGNQIFQSNAQEVFCGVLPSYSSAFYNAGSQGIKLEKILLLNSDEFDSQEYVIYNNENFSIHRIFDREDGLTEIYLYRQVGI